MVGATWRQGRVALHRRGRVGDVCALMRGARARGRVEAPGADMTDETGDPARLRAVTLENPETTAGRRGGRGARRARREISPLASGRRRGRADSYDGFLESLHRPGLELGKGRKKWESGMVVLSRRESWVGEVVKTSEAETGWWGNRSGGESNRVGDDIAK